MQNAVAIHANHMRMDGTVNCGASSAEVTTGVKIGAEMKSLDEVIKDLEEQIDDEMNCEYSSNWIVSKYDVEDAIQYLKMYKELANDSVSFVKWKENPPLTWEELRHMEGKPVWIEQFDAIDSTRGWRCCNWMLIEFINNSYLDARNSDGEQYNLNKDEQGYIWQAYRKER